MYFFKNIFSSLFTLYPKLEEIIQILFIIADPAETSLLVYSRDQNITARDSVKMYI